MHAFHYPDVHLWEACANVDGKKAPNGEILKVEIAGVEL